MQEVIEREIVLDRLDDGRRLDQVLKERWPDFSRSRLAAWMKAGQITVDGIAVAPSQSVSGGATVRLLAQWARHGEDQPQSIDLQVLFEDEHLLVIDKQSGLTVHPGAGTPDGTLVNALLHHAPSLAALPRAGLVHRLDRDTTGCLLVAKSLAAHTQLTEALAARRIDREYEAIVVGAPISGGLIDVPIGRDPQHRTRQAVTELGREARTHFRVVERFSEHALLRLKLDTGRTHQIRVHLQYAGFPIVGDPVYGGRFRRPRWASEPLLAQIRGFGRQALHARWLGFAHPASGDMLRVEAARPGDFAALLQGLRDAAREALE
ncbi:MAG: 23S rRNA pseudouridine(1911/1915/1917) synthase RluD [Xanthomonadales bacterium]|jgi:23S rRNA pseudouridine1911/1915/1917 synthase|nr:23S rRNA pseudouridine(1911/1915/1917) synthase RluD [Xanthomonadales bacterium]